MKQAAAPLFSLEMWHRRLVRKRSFYALIQRGVRHILENALEIFSNDHKPHRDLVDQTKHRVN